MAQALFVHFGSGQRNYFLYHVWTAWRVKNIYKSNSNQHGANDQTFGHSSPLVSALVAGRNYLTATSELTGPNLSWGSWRWACAELGGLEENPKGLVKETHPTEAATQTDSMNTPYQQGGHRSSSQVVPGTPCPFSWTTSHKSSPGALWLETAQRKHSGRWWSNERKCFNRPVELISGWYQYSKMNQISL